MRLGVGEPIDEREQAERRRDSPRYVDRIPVLSGVIDEQAHRHDRRWHGDHEVDVQAPAPGQDLRERTAQDQAE
jgi:hypothetical protein